MLLSISLHYTQYKNHLKTVPLDLLSSVTVQKQWQTILPPKEESTPQPNRLALHQKITRHKPTYLCVYGVAQRCHCIGLEFSRLSEFVQAWERLRFQRIWWASNIKSLGPWDAGSAARTWQVLEPRTKTRPNTRRELVNDRLRCLPLIIIYMLQCNCSKAGSVNSWGSINFAWTSLSQKQITGTNPRIFFAPMQKFRQWTRNCR